MYDPAGTGLSPARRAINTSPDAQARGYFRLIT